MDGRAIFMNQAGGNEIYTSWCGDTGIRRWFELFARSHPLSVVQRFCIYDFIDSASGMEWAVRRAICRRRLSLRAFFRIPKNGGKS